MGPLSDEELLARFLAEGRSSETEKLINELFQRHQTRVAAWCWRITGDLDSAADLAQEVFLKAFQRLESFRGESKFTTWLYMIARNCCLDALRARKLRHEDAGDMVLDDLADTQTEEIAAALERRESEGIVRQLIRESLDETESQVMVLHYVHELPLASVTRMLGLSNQSGAKAYIVSARRKLSRAFAQWKTAGTKGGGYAR